MTETYKILRKNINSLKTKDELTKMEEKISIHHKNSTITNNELMKLDVRIMEKLGTNQLNNIRPRITIA